MGRRIAMMLDLIRLLRTTEPKYSFEVLIFHITLGVVACVFSILGATRLWAVAFGVLWISLGIQYLRLRRVIKRQRRLHQEWMERAEILIEQAAAAYMQLCARRNEPLDPAELALLREDVKRAQEREAAGKCQ